MLIFAESLVNQGQWPGYLKVEDNEGIQDYENNGGHERDPENDRTAAFGSKDIGSQKNLLSSNHMAKAINELDLADCAKCSPSYRLLPDDVSAS